MLLRNPKVLIALAVLLFAVIAVPLSRSMHKKALTFETKDAAQAHCPDDNVVWVNTRAGTFYFQGTRMYEKTKNGAYACIDDAEKAGFREPKNPGQK